MAGAAPLPNTEPNKFERWFPLALAGLAGAPAVLGVIVALLNASTGQPFTIEDAAYYAGTVAMGVYVGFFLGGLAAGALNWMLTEGFGIDESSVEWLLFTIVGIAVVAFVLVFSSTPPDEMGSPGMFRVIGVVTVVGAGIWYASYRSLHPSAAGS